MYLPALIAWTKCLGMGGRPELGRKRPLLSSLLTTAGGPCLVFEDATEVSATEGAVDDADGGASVVAGGVGGVGSCAVGSDEANQVGTEMGFPDRVPMEPAREAWLCLVDLVAMC